MENVISGASDLFHGLVARLSRAISLELSQTQLIRMLVIVIMYISVIRPWMLKLAEKDGQKQLEAMEERDKARRDQEQKTQAVHNLRGNKKAAEDEQDNKNTSTTGSQPTNGNADSKARQRAIKEAEAELMNAEEVRARNLENWEEDQEFLKNFSRTSDRSYA